MTDRVTPYGLRMPDQLREGLKRLAAERHRSMNAQIVSMLESGLAAEKAASEQPAS
jgi:hypothetical protein